MYRFPSSTLRHFDFMVQDGAQILANLKHSSGVQLKPEATVADPE